MPKKSLTSISIFYVQEKNPFSFFFIKFIFFKHCIGFFPQKMYIFLMSQFKCLSGKNILCIFTFVKTLNHSPAQNLSNKKIGAFCVFCGQIYCFDILPSFDTHALYFVRPLYLGLQVMAILCWAGTRGSTSSPLFIYCVRYFFIFFSCTVSTSSL